MLCIRKMDLVDLTAWPFFSVFRYNLCSFILQHKGTRLFPGLGSVFVGQVLSLVCDSSRGV